MRLIKKINPARLSLKTLSALRERKAARAIVYDKKGGIGFIETKNGFHKLPGGGIERGENKLDALKRELLEELGCRVKITGEVGYVVEYRKRYRLKQTSYCYLAKVVGRKGSPSFTAKEIRNRFRVLWVSIDKALALLRTDKPLTYEGKFIIVRDKSFLERVKQLKIC